MVLCLFDISQERWEELNAVRHHSNPVVLKRQRQVLVHKKVDQGLITLWQSEILLLSKLQHRAFGKQVHTALTYIALLAGIDAEEEVEHDAHNGNEPYHQCPSHRLGWLTVVEYHVDDSHYHEHLIDTE